MHADCPSGEYCDSSRSCYQCSYITPSECDAVDSDCCSAAFRTQCTSNPRGCAASGGGPLLPCGSSGDFVKDQTEITAVFGFVKGVW